MTTTRFLEADKRLFMMDNDHHAAIKTATTAEVHAANQLTLELVTPPTGARGIAEAEFAVAYEDTSGRGSSLRRGLTNSATEEEASVLLSAMCLAELVFPPLNANKVRPRFRA